MPNDEAIQTPQCSLENLNAVSPFDSSPILNTKKKTDVRERKGANSRLVG